MGLKARKRIQGLALPNTSGLLSLRAWTLSDTEEFLALVNKNRSYLRQWMSWLDVTISAKDIRTFLQSSIDGYSDGSCHRWAISLEGKIIGSISLEGIIGMHKRAKIGYWLSQSHQGQGVITRAAQMVLRYAFTERNLNLLELRAATENQKSRAVASRLGMTLDGILRQQEWLYDHFVDHAIYTITESEWNPQGM